MLRRFTAKEATYEIWKDGVNTHRLVTLYKSVDKFDEAYQRLAAEYPENEGYRLVKIHEDFWV